MNKNGGAMFDDYIDMIKKDPASIESILADNEDMRDELEPILRTAALLARVEHPEIMPEQRRKYRQAIFENSTDVNDNLWGNIPVSPDQEARGKQIDP